LARPPAAYIEEQKLYQEFKLDEPWDSDHNKKLIAKMPKVFANPHNPKQAVDGKTTYLAPSTRKPSSRAKRRGFASPTSQTAHWRP